jgi:hypothetical protein
MKSIVLIITLMFSFISAAQNVEFDKDNFKEDKEGLKQAKENLKLVMTFS